MNFLPASKPRITTAEIEQLLAPYGLDRSLHPMVVVGTRAYYRDTMGAKGRNDRGIYDDAITLVTPNVTATFNGNTDPSEQNRTGLASLKPGVYPVYRFAFHRGKYLALCQRAGDVVVKRDNTEQFPIGWQHPKYGECVGKGLWKGEFGINIHRGGNTTTSSLGCQTIPPDQWDAFIALAKSEAQRLFGAKWKQTTITYVLIDNA